MISSEVPLRQSELLKSGDSWLIINNPELTVASLRERFSRADILLADLDETDAPSPAKEIAKKLIKRNALNPKFLNWTFQTGWTFLREGRKVESVSWENLLRDFRDDEEFQKVVSQYTPRFAQKISYPGVFRFYEIFPGEKIYISRNVAKVVEAFAEVFSFSQIFAEQFDKKRAIGEIYDHNPWAKRFVIKGDSREDEEIAQFLQEKRKRGEIKDVLSICVCQEASKGGFSADIYTSRDQTLLSKILEGKK